MVLVINKETFHVYIVVDPVVYDLPSTIAIAPS